MCFARSHIQENPSLFNKILLIYPQPRLYVTNCFFSYVPLLFTLYLTRKISSSCCFLPLKFCIFLRPQFLLGHNVLFYARLLLTIHELLVSQIDHCGNLTFNANKCVSIKINFHIYFTNTPPCLDLFQIIFKTFYIKKKRI
jgi:hypothetical protein